MVAFFAKVYFNIFVISFFAGGNNKNVAVNGNSTKIDRKKGRKIPNLSLFEQKKCHKIKPCSVLIETCEVDCDPLAIFPAKRIRKTTKFDDFVTYFDQDCPKKVRKSKKITKRKYKLKGCEKRDVGVQVNFSENSDLSLLQIELEQLRKKVKEYEELFPQKNLNKSF